MTYSIKNRLKKVLSGFTLIETLVAIFILSIAITGPLTIAARGLGTALIAKDQTTAFYLAQDAIEYVRYVRDSNCLAAGSQANGCPNGSWLNGLTNCISSNGTKACYFDSLGNFPSAPTACSDVNCSLNPMYFDPSNNTYDYNTSGTTRSVFTRIVTIVTPVGTSPNINSNEAAITAEVTWHDVSGATHSVTTREDIYNWQ